MYSGVSCWWLFYNLQLKFLSFIALIQICYASMSHVSDFSQQNFFIRLKEV